MQSLVLSAPAKVNLFLRVGALRSDGYHSVQTVMHTLSLADTVVLTPADDLTVSCDVDLGIPASENLVCRAAKAFSVAFEVDVMLDIRVTKRIPSGAGLGGGSSDAAAVLVALAHWARLPLDDARLLRVARGLGADVPFFLEGGAALMSGRGDELTRRLKPIHADMVLVKPAASVPTGEAYRAFDAAPTTGGEARHVADALRAQDVSALGTALANNMTPASSSLVPDIAEALAWLSSEQGVLGAAMAGSGSAVFAICADPSAAQRLARLGGERGWWSAACETSPHGATIIREDELA